MNNRRMEEECGQEEMGREREGEGEMVAASHCALVLVNYGNYLIDKLIMN